MRRVSGRLEAMLLLWLILVGATSARGDEPIELRPVVRTNSTVKVGSPPAATNTMRSGSVSNAAPENLVQKSNKTVRPTIVPGMFSQTVFEAQVALVRVGISSGSIDGLFGSQTKSAVRWNRKT